MGIVHTFKAEKLPQQQSTDSSEFKPDVSEMPKHFETYQELARIARLGRTELPQLVRDAVYATDVAALRVAVIQDREKNPIGYDETGKDGMFDTKEEFLKKAA